MWIRNAINRITSRFGGTADNNAVLNDGTVISVNAGKANTTKADGKIGAISTSLEKQTFRRSVSLPHASKIWIESGATATTINGAVNANSWSNGNYLQQVLAGTAGIARALPIYLDNTPHYFPFGASSMANMDWNKSWSLTLRGSFRTATRAGANDSGRFTFIVGNPIVSPTAGAGHFLNAKGVAIKILGKNGTTGVSDIWITAHDGSSETPSLTAQLTAIGGFNYGDFELVYIAGIGLYLYKDDVLLCSLTTGLPSGESTANHNRVGWFTENIAAAASNACTTYVNSIFVTREG